MIISFQRKSEEMFVVIQQRVHLLSVGEHTRLSGLLNMYLLTRLYILPFDQDSAVTTGTKAHFSRLYINSYFLKSLENMLPWYYMHSDHTCMSWL